MKEADIDNIKSCVSLINKLKKHEEINVNNKLIKAEVECIRNGLVKMLIQAESFNNDDSKNRQGLEKIALKVEAMGKDSLPNSEQLLTNRMFQLKIKALILMKTMRQKDLNLSLSKVRQLIKIIKTSKDLKYVLQLLFKIKSLHQLEILNVIKTNISHLKIYEQEIFLYMVALIKFESRPDEAKDILVNQLKNKYKIDEIEKDKKAVLSVISVLLQMQKQLLKQVKPQLFELQNSRFLYYQSTKKIIKNKFFFQYKIDLDLSKTQAQQKLATLDQNYYLLASPLFNFYFQKNQEIIQKLALTQVHRKIGISKSVLIQTYQLNSTNSKAKTKYKYRYTRNPLLYRKYLDITNNSCQKFAETCGHGSLFIKYNYNNLYSSTRFVAFNKELLAWGKNKVQIEKLPTKIKIKKVLGLIYGKMTERLQEEKEVGPCFSFLLKDRTVDLAMPKQRIEDLHRFILGSSLIINSHHSEQAQRLKQSEQNLTDVSQIELNNNKINFHQTKTQQITAGRLLWRDFFVSLAKKTKKYDFQLLPKAKYIIYLANKESMSSSKLNLRQKTSPERSRASILQAANKNS